ncbi:MAG: hypothetical protein VX871_11205 [Pseudomonadota bacterium]|nr:hypothetical protein [Pseudomonadota bacterium]
MNNGLNMAVGVILALLFAGVFGISTAAVLLADYMQPGRIMSEQVRQTLQLCAVAGAVAGLAAWALQRFAARRGFVVRFLYGVVVFALVFCAIGGMLDVVRNYLASPGSTDISLGGIYWTSLGGFYNFVFFLVSSLNIAILGLILAAGLILAVVGPREAD